MSIQGKFNPDNMQVLVSPERQQAIDTDALLTGLPITPRNVVADIGCDPLCCRADGFGLAFQNVGAAGDHGHYAAECGDPPRSGKADPAGGSGDDDVLCGEIHFILSL